MEKKRVKYGFKNPKLTVSPGQDYKLRPPHSRLKKTKDIQIIKRFEKKRNKLETALFPKPLKNVRDNSSSKTPGGYKKKRKKTQDNSLSLYRLKS